MTARRLRLIPAAAFAALAAAAQPFPPDAFLNPPDDARILMRWWWFGPAVTKAGLERDLRAMKQAGIGGFEVQPVYPLSLDDPERGIVNLGYLSDEFLDALRFTGEKAAELGLRMDLTLGSGWPYGGPHIPVQQAAARLRVERAAVAAGAARVPLPSMGAGESLIAAFAGEEMLDGGAARDGVLRLPAGFSGREVQFFVASRTGMMVKRPAAGAEGFVLDHYDRRAVENHLRQVGGPLLRALGGNRPYAVFCDSLEDYGNDWTGDFLAEFQRRRGYDLKPLLPALAGGRGEETAGLRYDWARTLTELAEERFLAPLHAWAQSNGTRLRAQVYGTPPVSISSGAFADLTEGEGVQWRQLSATRWASSASHFLGRAVTSSETWTWLHSPSFRATPLDIKAEADLHFLQGINQLIGHGWPHTPEKAEYPGWRFYAAAVFGEKNPWWIAMPEVSRYLHRVSYLLRQGEPANDVAVYAPLADAYSRLPLGRVNLFEALRDEIGPAAVASLLDAGFGIDFVDDRMIEQRGIRHRALVLPGVERIAPGVMQKIAAFAAGGGIVLASRRLPSLAPGRMAGEAEHRQVREAAARLGQPVSRDEGLGAALAARMQPDVRFDPPGPEIGFLHRAAPGGEIYFLANTSNRERRVKARFRVEGMNADWWDPMTGRTEAAAEAGAELRLDLAPYESRIAVFSRQARPRRVAPARPAPSPLDASAGWTVAFPETGREARLDRLRSWTEDEETRFLTRAVYSKTAAVPDRWLTGEYRVFLHFGEGSPVAETPRRNGMRAWLDGPVRDAAVVRVNGTRAGSVWCPPYEIEVTRFLRAGENRLSIEVGNTAINYMSARSRPDYRLLNLRYGTRFEPQDMENLEPLPSGLLGPVRLVAK